jgi:hypothetical protein
MALSNTSAPTWSPALDAYDYMKRLSPRDWAWEGLRRNPAYRAYARTFKTNQQSETLGGRALLTRMQERMPPAEAWALCCFR